MTREELLKEQIKAEYGSVLKFSKETGIPESSIRNIFSRGIDSVNAGTLVEICKKVNLDLEALMQGDLLLRPNPAKEIAWETYANEQNEKLATTCDELSDDKRYLLEMLPTLSDKHAKMLRAVIEQVLDETAR